MTLFEIVGILGGVVFFPLIIYAPFHFRKAHRMNQLRAELAKAFHAELASRNCPVCKKQYGDDVEATHYDEPYTTIDVGGQAVTRAVILTCPNCEYTTVFDPEGKAIENFIYKRTDAGLVGWNSSS